MAPSPVRLSGVVTDKGAGVAVSPGRFQQSHSIGSDVGVARMALAGTLSRYEGWFLVLLESTAVAGALVPGPQEE